MLKRSPNLPPSLRITTMTLGVIEKLFSASFGDVFFPMLDNERGASRVKCHVAALYREIADKLLAICLTDLSCDQLTCFSFDFFLV